MIDTHCHIDLYRCPEKILMESEKAGITVIAMTNLPSHFEMGYPHVLPFKKIRLALGMHPLYAEQHNLEFSLFLKNLNKTSYIGEVGLDFSREGLATKETQLITFVKILDAVAGEKKILSLHSRRAEKEILNLLIRKKIQNAIFHWYSGPLTLIKQIADAGYFFSVNTSMINSESGRKIIGRIPFDKILTETDGPFTKINGRQTVPSDVIHVIKEITIIKNLKEAEFREIVEHNFQNLLKRIR